MAEKEELIIDELIEEVTGTIIKEDISNLEEILSVKEIEEEVLEEEKEK